MNIDVPDAFAIQGVTLDEVQDFVAVRHDGRRQILQQFEDRVAFAQTATGLLSMPRLNSASSCTRLSICGLTRSAQMSLSLNGASARRSCPCSKVREKSKHARFA